jgi:serine/threonine-protein phosphatase 2B catalytic subunit
VKDIFTRGKLLRPEDALSIIRMATYYFSRDSNLLELAAPITVVGNLNGQFEDLDPLFEVGGDVHSTPYLFLGDYINHGSQSTELCLYLFACKCAFPDSIHLLRGHHECRHLASSYSFREECTCCWTPLSPLSAFVLHNTAAPGAIVLRASCMCPKLTQPPDRLPGLRKYGGEVYDAVLRAFDALPLAAVVAGHYFCVHGGIGPDIHTVRPARRPACRASAARSPLFVCLSLLRVCVCSWTTCGAWRAGASRPSAGRCATCYGRTRP